MLKAVAHEVDAQGLTKRLLAHYGLQRVEGDGGFAIHDAAVTRATGEFPALAHDGVFVGTGEIGQPLKLGITGVHGAPVERGSILAEKRIHRLWFRCSC